MGCTVRELQQRMDSHEFAEHMADHALEPWPEDKLDVLFAALRMQVAATVPSKKERALKLKDYLIQWEPPKPQTSAEIKAKLMAFMHRHNANLKAKG